MMKRKTPHVQTAVGGDYHHCNMKLPVQVAAGHLDTILVQVEYGQDQG